MSSLSFAPTLGSGGPACFSTTDPHYAMTGAPARMADGRIMTDYRPRCHQYAVSAAMTCWKKRRNLRKRASRSKFFPILIRDGIYTKRLCLQIVECDGNR